MGERLSVRVLQLGALAVVIAATTHRGFDLDRFLIPKELVLHLTAALAALLAIRAIRNVKMDAIDRLLVLFLLLSAISAIFATNLWLAGRALAISVSSVLLFWTARALAGVVQASGLPPGGRPGGLHNTINGLALAVTAAAISSLLQAYGVWIDLFTTNRAPGGTLGNRNFVAHAAAFGMPVVFLAALRGNVAAVIGVPVVTAALVLTRSRAAWLAFAASMLIVLMSMLFAPALRRDLRTWGRLALIVALIGGGVAAALLIPNTLNWRSDNPYLQSAQDLVNYQEGSGRGRLIQYQRSLALAARNPLLGVGPGNWPVEYPARVPARDPSIDTSEAGMTFNPWPSSDWVAYISERGFAATLVLGAALAMMAWRALRQLLAAPDADEAFVPMTLIATMAGAVVAGAFDAVLLLALPSLIVWTALGALSTATPAPSSPVLPIVLALVCLLGAARSVAQITAIELYTRGGRESLRAAARIDPGNYRVRMRLGRNRCEHALAARDLYPHAAAARAAARGCD